MCLAIPAKVVETGPDGSGIVDVGGVRRPISLLLVEDVVVGDYVIIHVGCAIAKLNQVEAAKTLKLFAQIASELGDSEFSAALSLPGHVS
jgi:hydrogenase expression/formation protein HypC